MRYFVVWPDGQRFGPADLLTLRQWHLDNRIDSRTILIEETSGRQTTAGQVLQLPGPSMPVSAGSAQAPGFSGYARPGALPANPHRTGQTEVIVSWVMGITGLLTVVCCPIPVLPLVGIALGVVARNKGQPQASAALWFNVAVLILDGLLITFFGLASMFG